MVEKHFAARAWMMSEDLSAVGNRLAADSYSFRSTEIFHTMTFKFTRGTEKKLQETKEPVTLRQITTDLRRDCIFIVTPTKSLIRSAPKFCEFGKHERKKTECLD
jgi:hypothetical protein